MPCSSRLAYISNTIHRGARRQHRNGTGRYNWGSQDDAEGAAGAEGENEEGEGEGAAAEEEREPEPEPEPEVSE